jgi:peptidoglycan hydrolase-like protein with peptidoglycan-binding domain
VRARSLRSIAAAALLVLSLGGTSAVALPASLPPTLSARLGLDFGTALVLSGAAVPIGSAAALARAVPTLGRKLPNLTRVYSLPTLREGAEGSAVRLAQARLDGLGDHLAIDGVFGPDTLAGVEAFNRAHGLTPTGTVGRKTWLALLGTAVRADRQSAWALAAAYDTSTASLHAWNAAVGGAASWATALSATVWVMPPDVRPSTQVLGSGQPLGGSTAPAAKTKGKAGASGPTPTTGGGATATAHSVMLVLAVAPGTPVAQVEQLAAWLGGRSIDATVVLPAATLASRGATAMVLEGEDLGVEMGSSVSASALSRGVSGAEAATGERPAVAYAGLYPSAVAASLAANSGLALVVGGQSAGPATRLVGGSVYVLSGTPSRLEGILPGFLTRAHRAGDAVGAVRAALRLAAAAA